MTTEMEETAVIGSILADPNVVNAALEILKPEHFTNTRMRVTFSAISRIAAKGIGIDMVTLSGHMTPEEVKASGGVVSLMEAAEQVPQALHVEHYARKIRVEFYKRRAMLLLEELKKDLTNEKIRKELFACYDEVDSIGVPLFDMKSGLTDYVDHVERQHKAKGTFFTTGYGRFDYITGGVTRTDMVVMGARTSRGKTSAMLCMASRYLDRGLRVLFVTGEMTTYQIMDRIVSIRSGIPMVNVRRGMGKPQWSKFNEEIGSLNEKPFFVADVAGMNLAKITECIQRSRPDVVFIDYIQIFPTPLNEHNRASFLTSIAYGLKRIAKERRIVLFTASQFNRAIEYSKDDREPTLSDLKESGGIEEAADIVVLMHFPAIGFDGVREGTLIVAKNRNGACGRIPFLFREATTAFEEPVDEEEADRAGDNAQGQATT